MREAFRYLIDYDGLASTVMKYYGIKQQTIVPGGLPGSIDKNPYKLDIEKAKQLLTEAGYPNGFSKVYYATPVTPEYEVAQSLQANAAKAGIKLDLQGGDHIGKFRNRQFEIFRLAPATASRTRMRFSSPMRPTLTIPTRPNSSA